MPKLRAMPRTSTPNKMSLFRSSALVRVRLAQWSAFNHHPRAYVVDFAAYGALVVALTGWLLWSAPSNQALSLGMLVVTGGFAWTAVEYLMHRIVLHRVPPFRLWHARHHEQPLALIGTPAALTIPLVALLVLAPAVLVLGHWRGLALTLGFTAGYLAYALLHHALHHWRLQAPWLRRRKLWHAVHHHLDGSVCFGVTWTLWDRLCGTAATRSFEGGRPGSSTVD